MGNYDRRNYDRKYCGDWKYNDGNCGKDGKYLRREFNGGRDLNSNWDKEKRIIYWDDYGFNKELNWSKN